MLHVKFIAAVDQARCTGCKLCEKVCLTDTIRVVDRVAVVDDWCMGCTRCVDICWQAEAITMARRPTPRQVGVDPSTVDAARMRELCAQAHRQPDELICVCANAYAGEIAAAIVNGARSFKELSFATGVLQGCQEFCVPPIQRMLKAAGVDITRAGGFLRYDQTLSMWDIPESARAHLGSSFAEDFALAIKNREGGESC